VATYVFRCPDCAQFEVVVPMSAVRPTHPCPTCRALMRPHAICPTCGNYRGVKYLQVEDNNAKK